MENKPIEITDAEDELKEKTQSSGANDLQALVEIPLDEVSSDFDSETESSNTQNPEISESPPDEITSEESDEFEQPQEPESEETHSNSPESENDTIEPIEPISASLLYLLPYPLRSRRRISFRVPMSCFLHSMTLPRLHRNCVVRFGIN